MCKHGAFGPVASATKTHPPTHTHKHTQVNVIEFYNTTFIQECKDLLCAKLEPRAATDVGTAASQFTPPSSPARPVRTLARNVSISPLTQERGYNIDMTPRTTRLYTFERASIGQVCVCVCVWFSLVPSLNMRCVYIYVV